MKPVEPWHENRRKQSLPMFTGMDEKTGMVPVASKTMESVMTESFRRWRSDRRYRSTLRELHSLTARELRELGIRPVEIQRLAREAARFS